VSAPSELSRGPQPAGSRGAAPALLAWIARLGVATAADLATRFELSPSRVERLIGRDVNEGLLREAGTLAREAPLLVATRAGLRAVGLSALGVCRASARAEAHLRAVASCAVWLERAHGERFEVWSERELRVRGRARWGGQRRFASPYVHVGAGAHKRADLLMVPRSAAYGLPLAVEVELSRKSDAQLQAICLAWKHCAEVAGVVYLASPAVVRPLGAAIERAGAGARIAVVALADCDVPVLRRRRLYRPQPLPDDLGLAMPRVPATDPPGAGAPVVGGARARPRSGVAAPSGRGGWVCSFRDAPRARVRARGASDWDMSETIRWVGRFGIVPLDALALHLRIDEPGLRALLVSAARAGYVNCARILRDEGPLLWATARGLRAAGLSRLRPCAVNYHSAIAHAGGARVAAALELEHGSPRVIGSRELAADWGARQRPALLVLPRRGHRSRPTAVLVARQGIAPTRLREIVALWTGCEGVAAVLVCSPSASVLRAAVRIADSLDAPRRVAVRATPPRPVTALVTSATHASGPASSAALGGPPRLAVSRRA
jgi:hypothetical protein